MKTFKEEALSLVNEFRKYSKPESSGFLIANEDVLLKNAKQCALLSINKILFVLEEELLELYNEARTCDINKKLQEHYLGVKKELELL